MAIEVGPGTPLEGVLRLPAPSEPAASFFDGLPPPYRGGRGPILRFFVGSVLSWYGDWLSTVALVVILYELTGNPAGPAGYILVRVAPRALGPLLGGRLADQLSPRRIIIIGTTLQAAFTASLILSDRAGAIWAIYAAVGLAQFAGALVRPSQSALLPMLVSDAALPRANATYVLFLSTSIFVGPAIGAALLLRVGPDPLFAIDAASFLVSALLVATLPSPRRVGHSTGRDAQRGWFASRGILLALRQPEVRMVAATNFASGLAVTVTQALLVVAARERFGGDEAVGYLYSSVGIGGTLGGLLALRWTPPRSWTRLAVFLAIATELLALTGFSAIPLVLVALLLLAVSSVGGSAFEVWGLTEVQRRAPPGFMARFNAVIFLSLYSGMLVGALWALGTASILHWDRAIEVACAAALVLVSVVWATSRSGAPVAELDGKAAISRRRSARRSEARRSG